MTKREQEWLDQARAKWRYRGKTRPSFAETPGQGRQSVWDFPRPPIWEPEHRLVRVTLGGEPVAQSRVAVRVLETSHPPGIYVPRSDVRTELFSKNTLRSLCEWKGQATYWDVHTASMQVRGRAWSYEEPFTEFAALGGHVSFYPADFECYLGDERVTPQPGHFYAGWVTSELCGPFKGEPGTSDW